ncbi:MAG: hypothetical protein ABFD81_07795 [Syntrophaceae bacterium]
MAAGFIMFCLTFILTASPTNAWATVAANTQIIAQAELSYFDGTTTKTATASVTITVGLVATAPDIVPGSAQSALYAGAGTSLTDSFAISAQSNGLDTYSLSTAVAGSTNTSGATATAVVNSIVLGATAATEGSTATVIVVPSDGLADNSVNGIEVGDTVIINHETRTVIALSDNGEDTSSITLNAALGSTPGVGVTIAEQKIVGVNVTAGTIMVADSDVSVSVTLSATSATAAGAATTSGALTNTFGMAQASFTQYVRNITTPNGSGSSYLYHGESYYASGVTAKPGDMLEYLTVTANTGLGTVTNCVVSDTLATNYVTLNAGVYSGAKDITYVDEAGTASYLTLAADADEAAYDQPTLDINAGTGATNIAGGAIAAGKSILILYRATVGNANQGNQIVSSARFSSPDIATASSSVTVTVVNRTASVVEMFNYAPLGAGVDHVNIVEAAYQSGGNTGPFVNLPAPAQVGSATPIDLNQPVPLSAATQLHQGDPLFISVTDRDQNLDATQAETVLVTFSNSANSDTEVIRLTETGPNTGVFAGYIPTVSPSGPVVSYNGMLSINTEDNVTAHYVDCVDGSDASTDITMVDPCGIVFDSSTGKPVSGATITIQTASGGEATVYGDDGVSIFPSTIISGATVTDSSGRVYTFPAGEYRFPFLLPGSYRYLITPPAGYGAPSTVETSTLQALPGWPFTIIPGSRGEVFVINAGPAVRIDIPIDPYSSTLWLQKSAGKEFAGHGDFIPYRLTVTNVDPLVAATGVKVFDKMPIGFRLRGGSIRIDGVPARDPNITADGRILTFSIGTLAAGASATIEYVTEVTVGTRLGQAVNSAWATAAGIRSNTAKAMVTIRDDFMRTHATLMGRVTTGACNEKTGEGSDGVEGVRIYLEDGTFVISDKRGLFHFEGVRDGLHVVQLDVDSLPEGYEPYACTENTRFAGRAFSQFVEIRGGGLWRTDFHIRRKMESAAVNPASEPMESAATEQKEAFVSEPADEQRTETALPQAAPSPALAKTPDRAAAPKTAQGITIAEPVGILSPAENDILPNPVNMVRVCLDSRLKPRLLLDDKEVAADRIGFTMKDEKAGKTLYSYIGVDSGLRGEHVVQLQGIDPFGNIRFKQGITVRRSGEIAGIRLKSADGNVADGKTPVKLQLEILDADATPIPAEVDLEIREGTVSPMKQLDNLSVLPPAGGTHAYVHMSRDGEVLFQPVTNSGLYRVVLAYNNATLEAETYVQPKMRDWVLVGLAEGTLGYNTVSGNMENLQNARADEDLYDNGRVAFFAKGQIKGKWLLTMAYDSDKPKADSTNGLFQAIDPDTYYTLYGDASLQQYDAASAKKLYIKIEREQFYALFGDYDTDLTVTELSRYSRRMTGFKTEMQTRDFELKAFASQTEQVYQRDEIPGDGTSGMYRLSRKSILPNTEKITIEVRNRFQSEILVSSRTMSRFTDYSIDYDSGVVIFKEPIYSRDENLNPIMIIAEYETVADGEEDYTYGGRAGVKLLDNKLKAGGSYIHEGQGERDSNLYGVDTTVNLNQSTKLRAELATSDYDDGNENRSGNAYLAEISRSSKTIDAKAYYREQESGFGLGQQPGSEAGTRKLGAEGAYNIQDGLDTTGNIYRQYNLETDATRDVAEGRLNYFDNRRSTYVGFLHAQDDLDDGSDYESNQVIMGAKVPTLNDRLSLSLDYAQSIANNENSDYPTRLVLGAEYKATQSLTLLAAQEFTWGEFARTQNSRVGLRSGLWQGASLTSGLERQFNENSQQVFATAGLKQTWQINSAWKMDAGLDRSHTIASSGNYRFNTNVAPASGSHEDFTAVSSGATYQVKHLIWDGRAEVRTAESEDKWGLMSGMVKEIDDSWAWSGRTRMFQTSATAPDGTDSTAADLRLGLVYRPVQTEWILLDRLDLLIDKQSGGTSTDFSSWRIINNVIANYHPRKDLQLSVHYGAKYVRETIYENDYRGYTDFLGAEGRYDINKDWDIGLHGSLFHSWHADQFDYCSGASIGYDVVENAWISVGYNLTGFNDRDFSRANFTSKGPFVRFRFKFDQDSVGEAAKWLKNN